MQRGYPDTDKPHQTLRQPSRRAGTPGGAETAVDSSRPGFHLTCTYRGHSNDVKRVACNQEDGTFTSVDEKGFKVWQPTGRMGDVEVLRDLQFPGLQGNYITCVLYVESLQIFIAAGLEGSLHVYTSGMQLMVKMELPRSARGAVVDMAYDTHTDELITAGATGVRVWYTVENFEEWEEKHCDFADKPRFRGKTGPWIMGEYQTVQERMTLRVPGAKNVSTNTATAARHHATLADVDWVTKLQLHESSRILFTIMGVSVYGFSLVDGVRCFEWEAIHSQPITDLIYLPQRNQVITSSLEPSTVIWRVASTTGQLQRMRAFGTHSAGVTSICLHPKEQSLLTSSLDGMVILWSMQSFEPIFRAKMSSPVTQLQCFGDEEFVFVMGREVRVMWLQSVQTIFGEYSSNVVSLQYLGQNLLLASFEDTSVRIISSTTHETLIAVPPQLSSASLVTARLSTWRSELYVLLSNGQVHCWDIEMGKIPKLTTVLNPDMKFKVACFTILEGSLLHPHAGMELGLDVCDRMQVKDYLIAGTSDGDAQFLDLDKRGDLTCRVPVSKVAGISKVEVDALRARLVTVSEFALQIWSLQKFGECLIEIRLKEQPHLMEVANGMVFLAGQTGALKSLDMLESSAKVSNTVGGHGGRVCGLEPNLLLRHFVTAGVDGLVKIFDWDKTLKLSLTLAARLSSVCWLNDRGDILSACGSTLYKISVETCYDALKQQSFRRLYDYEKVQQLQATDIFAMRGSQLLDSLLVGLEARMLPHHLPSIRPPTVETFPASMIAGSARRSASMPRQLLRSMSRSATPDATPRYMLVGIDNSRPQHWRPVVNRIDMRLLIGQPSPPTPPEQLSLRTHQGLPGMKNFSMVPASSPAGVLKALAPVDFREGTPAEMWRKAPQKLITSAPPVGAKSASALETNEDGEYVVMTYWGMEQTQKTQPRKQPKQKAGTFANNIATERLGGGIFNGAPHIEEVQPMCGLGPPASSGHPQHKSQNASPRASASSGDESSDDEDDVTDKASHSSRSGSANISGSESNSADTEDASEDSDGLPEGLEDGMQEAYQFICTQYDLSEEVIKKLMLEQEMLRAMDGSISSDRAAIPLIAKRIKKRRKKKKTSGANTTTASSKGVSTGAGQKSQKAKKKRRKHRNRKRILVGQDGVDFLRGVSKETDIITGCHEYNACEVKTLAANQSFLPKVTSPASKHAKTPLGFQNRTEFPGCPRGGSHCV